MLSVLDCTLRDGGYVNNWEFPSKNIGKILFKLESAGVDIIECGYLNYNAQKDHDSSIYQSMEKLKEVIAKNVTDTTRLSVMINYGEYPIEKLPEYKEEYPKKIRVAFHKKDAFDAISYCKQIKSKGYDVFLQPMVTLNYTDEELLKLIEAINELKPSAAYIVDSFGSMRKKDVRRISSLYNHNLSCEIAIGFHAHNSLQLAFSNALEFIEIIHERQNYIVDVSIFGMGRGAGNLCSELMINYLIENLKSNYKIAPILEIMDEYLMAIYLNHPWGYSAAYYLSAIKKCHPNYATYLISKQTLSISSIEKCLSFIPLSQRGQYDEKVISQIYEKYQSIFVDDSRDVAKIQNIMKNRKILLLGAGKSVTEKSADILKYIASENPLVVAINSLPKIPVDLLFVSNRKIYSSIEKLPNIPIIFTSNVSERPECAITLNYSSLVNDSKSSSDNAGLMFMKFCFDIGIQNMALAGFDGYNYKDKCFNVYENKFVLEDTEYEESVRQVNKDMADIINQFRRKMVITFITDSLYDLKTGAI